MNDLFGYINFRGDIPFFFSPASTPDYMILSVLAGIDFDGLVDGQMLLSDLAKAYKERDLHDLRDGRMKEKEELLYAVAESKRYEKVKISNYVKKIDSAANMTFYAMTFWLGKFDACIVFRGTDGTLLSWKENFVCMYEMPSAGQSAALEYVRDTINSPFVRYTCVGHSKGGNLAGFAAMFVDPKKQKHIKKAVLFDSPGYMYDITQTDGYKAIRDRIIQYVPESCVIGNLMNLGFERKIVASTGKGVFQHDLFLWKLKLTEPVLSDNVNEFGESLSRKINDWVNGIDVIDRSTVVNELFVEFEKNGVGHIADLLHMDLSMTLKTAKSLTRLSPENKTLLSIILKELRSAH